MRRSPIFPTKLGANNFKINSFPGNSLRTRFISQRHFAAKIGSFAIEGLRAGTFELHKRDFRVR